MPKNLWNMQNTSARDDCEFLIPVIFVLKILVFIALFPLMIRTCGLGFVCSFVSIH